MRVTKQEITDWKNHPITKNFFEGTDEIIGMIDEKLSNIPVDFNERELTFDMGVKRGLQSLKTYDPEASEDVEVVDE